VIETAGWVIRGLYSTSTLLAAGFALLCLHTVLQDRETSIALRKWCSRMAMTSAALSCAWVVTLTAELGGEWPAALDPYYYQIIGKSPAAELMLWRSFALIGLLCWSRFAAPSWLGT